MKKTLVLIAMMTLSAAAHAAAVLDATGSGQTDSACDVQLKQYQAKLSETVGAGSKVSIVAGLGSAQNDYTVFRDQFDENGEQIGSAIMELIRVDTRTCEISKYDSDPGQYVPVK